MPLLQVKTHAVILSKAKNPAQTKYLCESKAQNLNPKTSGFFALLRMTVVRLGFSVASVVKDFLSKDLK
jgi:hypothetical protein